MKPRKTHRVVSAEHRHKVRHEKTGLLSFAALIAAVAPLLTGALADTGIGLFTSTNAETIMEGNELCITYKVYNPFDTDIWATLSAEGELANLTTYTDKPVLVPKGTSHQAGRDMKICFSKENLHSDCLIGAAFCRSCEPKTYSGSVVAHTTGGAGGGSGSSTTAAAGQALRLSVNCNPNPPLPFRYLVYAAGTAVFAGILWWAKKNVRLEIGLKKKKKGKPARKKKKRAGRKPGKRRRR